MTNVIICGAGGKMGKVVLEISKNNPDIKIAGGIDKFSDAKDFSFPVFKSFSECNISCDVIIDFSRPEALGDILKFCLKNKCGAVLGTTGYTGEQKEQINDAAKNTAIFQSFNMSLGINLISNLINQAAKFLGDDFDVEIIEKHHNQKVDAPSGTALMLADSVSKAFDDKKEYIYGRHDFTTARSKKEIGISSVRGGNIVGEHEVLFIGRDETISFTHKAASKDIFALGAIRAAIFLKGKKSGKYSMTDIINN